VAGAAAAVEQADDEHTTQVHTCDAREDDVPDELLDKDQGRGTTAIFPRMQLRRCDAFPQ
jgi:hypothetical protein